MSAVGRPSSAAGARRLSLRTLTGRPDVCWLAAVFALAFGLRLVFALAVSRVQLVWDAAAYWGETQTIRASACGAFAYCDPGPTPGGGLAHAVDTVLFSKNGLLPLIDGAVLSVLPNTVDTALVLFAMLDALACVMIAIIVLRLGGPLWVAVLGAVFAAIYVPGIVGDGSFLQQPLIRFALTAAVCAYACALTTVRHRRLFVWLGTAALVLVAFSSQTTRPLFWAVSTAVIVIAASRVETREIASMQLRATAFVAVGLYVGALLVATFWPEHSFFEAFTNIGLGLSTGGTAVGQVTVLSFPHFWPTDAWPFFADANATESLFADVRSAPVNFAAGTAYGMYANWRFPDLLYFQKFGLGTTGQIVQHVLLVVTGFAGVAWLLGQAGPRRLVGTTVLVTVALISVLAGMVSVEPRRVGALVPLLALGTACFVWSVARRRSWGRFELAGAMALVICVVAWLLPAPRSLFSPEAGFALTVVFRVVASAAAGAWLLADWRRRWDGFSVAAPAALGAALLAVVAFGQLRDGDWRASDTAVISPIHQQVDGLALHANLEPWLVADFGTAADATASSIYVNGKLVKPAGAAMRRWQVDGGLLGWAPYADLKNMGVEDEPRTWLATPLNADVLSGSRATIEVRPPEGGATIARDYAPNAASYDGPSLDPFFGGFSLWRWIWNGEDPRISYHQDLGARYSSGGSDGRYRLYISEQPFGAKTNMLQGATVAPASPATTGCPNGQRYATTADARPGNPWLCLDSDGGIAYFDSAGGRLGASDPKVLARQAPRGTVIDRVDSRAGSVELVSGGGPLLIANVYSRNHELEYSLGFHYPAALPSYA